MKTFKILLLGFFTINSAHAQIVAVGDGGMSGGGGGVVITDPVGEEVASDALRNARKILVTYFYHKQALDSVKLKKHPAVQQVMEKIIPTILSTKIKQMRSTPCFDQNNEERDGSIVSSVPGTICMSTFNLGKKLTLENVFDQSIALAAHEFSHLMGADEALAVALQKEIILDLSGMSSLRTYSDIYNQIIFRNLYEIARYPGYDGDYNGHISAMWIDSFRMELGKIMYPNDFSILTKERLDLVKNVYQQFSVFTIGTERYNALFGSKNEVSAADVMREAKIIDIPASSETFMIQKVVDQATYNNLLLRMIDQFKQMKSWRYSFENLSFEDEMLNWH